MTTQRPFIIADESVAADRLASRPAEAARIVAFSLFAAIASTAIGIGLFFAALPQEPPVLNHYLPAGSQPEVVQQPIADRQSAVIVHRP